MQNDARPTAEQLTAERLAACFSVLTAGNAAARLLGSAKVSESPDVLAMLRGHIDAQATLLEQLERERHWLREWVLMRSFGGRWPHIDSPTHLAGLLAALHADTPPAQPAPPPAEQTTPQEQGR